MKRIPSILSVHGAMIIVAALLTGFNHAHAQNIPPGPNIGDRGQVTFTYRNQTVTYKTVRAADSNVWTLQNLGSPKVPDSLLDFDARGDFFQWGRWDDGHQLTDPTPATTGTAPTPNNPSAIANGSGTFYIGTVSSGHYINLWWDDGNAKDTWSNNPPSATNGLDPCSALGDGWHVPTKAEWEALIGADKIMTTQEFFDSEIKLSATGSRAGSSGYLTAQLYPSSSIQYWTSTPSNASAWFVNMNPQGTTIPFSDVATLGRGTGRPCRCIKLSNCTSRDSVRVHVCRSDLEQGYTLPGGQVVDSEGVYTSKFESVRGCDSIIVTVLNKQVIDTSVSVDQQTLTANANGAAYQWLSCDSARPQAIPAANRKSFSPETNGDYAVAVTVNGCTDTSSCYKITGLTGMNNLSSAQEIKVYPNPAQDKVYILAPEPVKVTLYSIEGKVLLRRTDVSEGIGIGNLSEGLYFIQIENKKGELLKVEKVLKVR